MLSNILDVDYKDYANNDLDLYKGSIVENYVAQELTSYEKKYIIGLVITLLRLTF